MELDQKPDISFLYWNNCLIRLSLDSVLPMYKGIGLYLSDSEGLNRLLKTIIKQNLQEKGEFPWLKETVKEEVLHQVNKEFSTSDFNNFYYFCTTVFDTASEGIWSLWMNWKDSLLKFLDPQKYWIDDNLFFLREAMILREKLVSAYQTRKFDSQSQKLLNDIYDGDFNFSEWDLKIFDFANFKVDCLLDDDYSDPFLQLDLTANMNQFQQFWEENILELNEVEIQLLYGLCNKLNLDRNTPDRIDSFVDKEGNSINYVLKGNYFSDLTPIGKMRRKVIPPKE